MIFGKPDRAEPAVRRMRIACVHQGYELYGSDRCFVESVTAIRERFPDAEIEVVLPQAGPILAAFSAIRCEVTIAPLWVLRRRAFWWLATVGLLSLPAAIVRAFNRFRTSDMVYINTSVIADHLLAARLFRGRALVHVHEIPGGTSLKVLRALIRWSAAEVIFNSKTTKATFHLPPGNRNHVIYNGIAAAAATEPAPYDGMRPLRVLMLGRISRIKGQEILLDALSGLPQPSHRRVEVRIVGSAFEDPAREVALRARIRDQGLADIVRVEDFVSDTAPLYEWADIVVVPSRLPESLGRVAIEAMAAGRPPIASDIGGLAEVVEDGRTGWLVPPGRPDALAETLRRVIDDPLSWRSFAAAGRIRYRAMFSAEAASAAIGAVMAKKLLDRECRI